MVEFCNNPDRKDRYGNPEHPHPVSGMFVRFSKSAILAWLEKRSVGERVKRGDLGPPFGN
jgi:hypothetical protein